MVLIECDLTDFHDDFVQDWSAAIKVWGANYPIPVG